MSASSPPGSSPRMRRRATGQPADPREGIRAVGAAARDRHDALDRRHVRGAGQRAHRRPRRAGRSPSCARTLMLERRAGPRSRRGRARPPRCPIAPSPSASASSRASTTGCSRTSSNDDYEHVHVVDKIIAELALDSGRQRGQLATYGTTPGVPPTEADRASVRHRRRRAVDPRRTRRCRSRC